MVINSAEHAQTVLKQHIDSKAVVEDLLTSDERCRNDDLWLLLQFWQQKQQIQLFVPFDELHKMVPAETITRVRREIQNRDLKLLPTDPDVIIKRKIKQEVLHSYYSASRPELVNAVIMKRFAVR